MAFPLAAPLSSTISAGCPLFDGFSGTTGASDFSAALAAGLRLPFPAPPVSLPRVPPRSPSSCASSFLACSGSSTARDRCTTCELSPCSVLPSAYLNCVGIPDLSISRLNGWPASLPCQRLAASSRIRSPMTRGQDGSPSFLVPDLHRLPLASLCWRTQIQIQDSHVFGVRGDERNWALTPIAGRSA